MIRLLTFDRLLWRSCSIAMAVLSVTLPLAAQSPDKRESSAESTRVIDGDASSATEGFWPTPKMTELLIRRWALDAGARYELQPDQQQALEARMLEHWQPYLLKNRRRIQPVVNEFLEMRLGLEPPSSDQVANWAKRATPIVRDVREHFVKGQQKMGAMLTPQQRAGFELDRMKSAVTLQSVEASLNRWRNGEIHRGELWDRPSGYREDQSDHEAAVREGETVDTAEQFVDLPERAAEELSFWMVWVDQFCDLYQLDRSQRNAAHSILREMLQRARDHVRRNTERIEAVERIIEDASAPPDEPAVLAEIEAVYGPIEGMGRELQTRIQRLPTNTQLRRVELLEQAPTSTQPSPSTNGPSPQP